MNTERCCTRNGMRGEKNKIFFIYSLENWPTVKPRSRESMKRRIAGVLNLPRSKGVTGQFWFDPERCGGHRVRKAFKIRPFSQTLKS